MKKLMFVFLSILAAISCSNVEQVGPFEDEKAICRENADTIIAHMKGWKEMSSYYNEEKFYSTEDHDGRRTEYVKYVLVVTMSDGNDTLMVMTDGILTDEWSGRVYDRNAFLSSVKNIKRHNIAIKKACGTDSLFDLSAGDSKVINAIFKKEKPKEHEPPLEDYGLTEDDIKK